MQLQHVSATHTHTLSKTPCRRLTHTQFLQRFLVCVFGVLALISTSSQANTPFALTETKTVAPTQAEQALNRKISLLRSNPQQLNSLLQLMPKGADLHNHLVGTINAEQFLTWAALDNLCIDSQNMSLVANTPCTRPLLPANKLPKAPLVSPLREQLIDAMSMRGYTDHHTDHVATESPHDHFFNTFFKFYAAAEHRLGDEWAIALDQAARDHVSVVELMDSPGMLQAAALSSSNSTADWDLAWTQQRATLQTIAARVSAQLDEAEVRQKQLLHCHSSKPHPGCKVQSHFIAQVYRTRPIGEVFSQVALGFILTQIDPRFVSVNLVAPEDDSRTLSDYHQQMQLIHWFKQRYPQVPISLHAGELTPEIVSEDHLNSHIREAIEIAGAQRIGHGVSITHETDFQELLTYMRQHSITVEINLSSNDLILGVKGKQHPLSLYLNAQVPVVLATDDAGVSRINMTHEYAKAVIEQELSYTDLKRLARQSLVASFLNGESLWQEPVATDHPTPVTACQAGQGDLCRKFLAHSERARAQWNFEQALLTFERQQTQSRQ